ncbi:MAG TPA: malto-oligosyltrehalose trehalohydrolase [Actinomycetales bacterium]|nr:malto-oligosyltrehalose trehalohydrolase [Actinomycetales bacterium]
MHLFTVWAPDARSVDVQLGAGTELVEHALQRRADGWWGIEVESAGHGTDYAFRVDDGPGTPDPRSAWQPDGVHGPSRVFDPGRHLWHDHGWAGPQGGAGVLGGLLYELHVGTVTPQGTLAAAEQRLDALVDLGVDVVELMPVAAFPGRWGWGYDGVQPYAVHEAYGGPGALQHFVDACHQRGLGVCLDVVYNHLGPSGNYLSRFGPYFTDRHHTPWGEAVNLDGPGSDEVRRWVVDNALRWFGDFHVDALRLDAVHELKDDSPRHVLAQLSDETAALSARLGRPLGLIAESDLNDPRTVAPTTRAAGPSSAPSVHESTQAVALTTGLGLTGGLDVVIPPVPAESLAVGRGSASRTAGGLGMTAQWDDDLHHALHALLTGERQGYYADFGSLEVLAKCLTEVFRHDGCWSSFRQQVWGHPVDRATQDGRRFVGYLQTHDQVGNRATGDRISASVTPGQLAIGAALVLTSTFTPMVFMGEEWAASTPWQFFTDFDDPQLAEAVREGRRAEFADHGWAADAVPDPQSPTTRDASVLDWGEREHGLHGRVLDWYRSLVALRRRSPQLRSGRLDEVQVRWDDASRWLVVARPGWRVACNLAETRQPVPLDVDLDRAVVELSWSASAEMSERTVALDGHDVVLLHF